MARRLRAGAARIFAEYSRAVRISGEGSTSRAARSLSPQQATAGLSKPERLDAEGFPVQGKHAGDAGNEASDGQSLAHRSKSGQSGLQRCPPFQSPAIQSFGMGPATCRASRRGREIIPVGSGTPRPDQGRSSADEIAVQDKRLLADRIEWAYCTATHRPPTAARSCRTQDLYHFLLFYAIFCYFAAQKCHLLMATGIFDQKIDMWCAMDGGGP